jgi:hypothetical protein
MIQFSLDDIEIVYVIEIVDVNDSVLTRCSNFGKFELGIEMSNYTDIRSIPT